MRPFQRFKYNNVFEINNKIEKFKFNNEYCIISSTLIIILFMYVAKVY
jgi:hypothetical protein